LRRADDFIGAIARAHQCDCADCASNASICALPYPYPHYDRHQQEHPDEQADDETREEGDHCWQLSMALAQSAHTVGPHKIRAQTRENGHRIF
jgi:hypothetical protein